jgi:hypothetical protein
MANNLPMMTGPVLALRAALRSFWLADTGLITLLGGPKIYDTAPRTTTPPYITFGAIKAKQWLGGSQRGFEQDADVLVWSRQPSDQECLALMGRLSQISDGALLTMAGYQLWPLQVTRLDCANVQPQGWRQGAITLKAFSTVLP